jgi:type IV secretion/conjugal transfer VirB4 family ATPase
MLSIRSIRRDFRSAGSLHSMLAPWGFADDGVLVTKGGQVGVFYRLAPIDYECLDHAQRGDVVHRYEAALRLLDERFQICQYLFKRRIDPLTAPQCSSPVVHEAIQRRTADLNQRRNDLYTIEIYAVLLLKGLSVKKASRVSLGQAATAPIAAIRGWLSSSHVTAIVDAELTAAIDELRHHARSFEVQTADTLRPHRLDSRRAFAFLRQLVNYDPEVAAAASPKYDSCLDYFMADTPVECERRHLSVGEHSVKVLTMKEPPSTTRAHQLEALYTVPGEFIACLEWQRIPSERMRREIHSLRRHHFNRRTSLRNYVASDVKPEEMLVDESANATVRHLNEALTDLEVNGHVFGQTSLTLVMYDREPEALERAVAEARNTMANHDGMLVAEGYNLLNAWLSIVPGNSAFNVRRLALSETNCADLSFLFTLDGGSPECPHLGREALAVFETEHNTLYHLALHVNDVGHTAILGATGSGKSFLLNCLLTQAQRYDPLTVVFDIGRSYRKLASVLGGSFLEIGLRTGDVTINPFAHDPTPEHLHFLNGFLRVLLEGRDGHRLSETEDRECYEAIQHLYVLAPEQRRLRTLAALLPRALALRLGKWIEGGRYADLFDHVHDNLTVQNFQVFEFESMRAFPDLLEPLLFYVFHRVIARMTDPALAGVLKICLMEEAWEFIRHERFRQYAKTVLKTGRKHHVAMLLATQSIQDFASADLVDTVRDNCPTKCLLANPGLDPALYAEVFQLNHVEVDRLRKLAPRRQFLLKRPGLAKVLNVNVDPFSYALYTNTPVENERINALIKEHGLSQGLEEFAATA